MGTFIATVQNRQDARPAAVRVVAATIDEAADDVASRYETVLRLRSESPAELYYYRPLAASGGTTLKCAGICTPENLVWFPIECAAHDAIYLPGVFILVGYRGDRIDLSDASSAVRF